MKKTHLTIITKSMEGGVGSFALSLSRLPLLNPNYEVTILALEKPYYRTIDSQKYNITYFSDSPYPQKYFFNFFLIQLIIKEYFWLFHEIKKNKTNLIIAVDTHGSYLSILLKLTLLKKIKVIVTYHIDASLTSKERMSFVLSLIAKIVGKFLLKRADTIIGVSKGVSKDIKKYFSLKTDIITIYNGISKTLNKKDNPPPPPLSIPTIISVSRLSNQKDIDTLINSFNILQSILERTRLIILGDGPLRQDLEEKVEKLKLNRKVRFIGWKQNITPYLKNATLFVLSSKREGFPYVILEAMNAGLPIIATDAPYGPSEALDNGKYGLLIPPNNPREMSIAMYKLLTNKKLLHLYSDKSYLRSKDFTEIKMLHGYDKIIKRNISY